MRDELRSRVRDGDPDAFGLLFDRYAEAVCNHVFRLIGDWSAAQDVMSAVFLEAWRVRGRIEPGGGTLRPWLLGIATNLARNHNRAARRGWMLTARLPAYSQHSMPDIADEVARSVDNDALVRATREALARLRPEERELLALCVWAELSYEEAAEALGIPVGTVRSRISRARAKVRRRVAQTSREPRAAARGTREPNGAAGQLNTGRAETTRTRWEATR
ncbi:sigma-70 family RNA polymerase sigma factor [Actinospica robiniae]|uniref:RNA polymerase sigma factor n=1 Tax=Actinospica robiniae TaxID=304901 RepID=UPI0006864394